jgi:hypothetical protein
MMMECPRCGFAQPKDRYCASCGLDVEHFVVKPKPLLSRIVQNPNFHLSLIGLLVVLVVAYIFYAQRELVTREVGNLLKGAPVRSRDAGEAKTPAASQIADPAADDEIEVDSPPAQSFQPQAAELAAMAPSAGTDEKATDTKKISDSKKVEISSWEVSRETLSTLLTTAEKVGESNGGRAYMWRQGAKAIETVQTAGHRLSLSRTMPLQPGSTAAIEAQTAPTDPFQFGLYLQVTKSDDGESILKWDSTLVLPAGTGLTEVMLTGNAGLSSTSALLIIFDPPNRTPREDVISRAGDGPWAVLNSPEFRNGISEWAVLIQLVK